MSFKKLGLIGYPLTHSFSQKYFTEKFQREDIKDWQYQNFELAKITGFPELLKNEPNLVGLNVTIPYKEQVLSYVDILSGTVQEIGAANTLVITKEKKVKAYNTDVYGFERSLKPLLKPQHQKALILGTGGASKAIAFALEKLNISYLTVSRNPKNSSQISYNQIDEILLKNYLIVINTTPLGTYPRTDESPQIPYDFVTNKHLFYDLTYNPAQTLFLKQAAAKGANVSNGLKMLHLQAEKAWQIWRKNT